LESTDVTNVILGKNFSLIDYSHNKIEKIKNEINWACCNDLQDNETLQGGFLGNIHDSWQDTTENNQNISTYIREEEERNSHSASCCAEY
jgi:hypothetical protein